MKRFLDLLRLRFVPSSVDFGLLALRLWIGSSLLLLHGWSKLTNFSSMSEKFLDPIGLGSTASLSLAVAVEVGCAILLLAGWFTRLAAVLIAFELLVAFLAVHGAALSGPRSGELALVYAGAAFALFCAGGGKFSLDGRK